MTRLLSGIVSLLITFLLLYGVFSQTSVEEFWSILRGIDARFFAFYVTLSLLGVLFRAVRYHIVLGADSPGLPKVALVTCVRNALVDSLPARMGELSFFYLLSRLKISLALMTSCFAACFALDLLVLGALVSLALLFSLENMLLGAVVLVGVGAVSVVLVFSDYVFDLASRKIPRFDRFFRETATHFKALRNGNCYFSLLGLTVLLRLAKYLSLYLLLMAVLVGSEWINPLTTTLAFIAAEASASLPVSGVLGFGAYEKVWETLISLSGLPISDPLAVAFAVHLLSQIVGYSLGALGYFIFFSLIGIQKLGENDQNL